MMLSLLSIRNEFSQGALECILTDSDFYPETGNREVLAGPTFAL